MKKIVILLFILVSMSAFSQLTKAKQNIKSLSDKDIKSAKVDAPCADSKEDLLKKLEEKKEAQAKANKGFSLQGATDTGCTIK